MLSLSVCVCKRISVIAIPVCVYVLTRMPPLYECVCKRMSVIASTVRTYVCMYVCVHVCMYVCKRRSENAITVCVCVDENATTV